MVITMVVAAGDHQDVDVSSGDLQNKMASLFD
jgi:hypothetical protein